MANKKISGFNQTTNPTSTDMFLVEEASGNTFERQTRNQIHTLQTGEDIDTGTGVDLSIKAGGNAGITVASSDGDVTIEQDLTVDGTSTLTGLVTSSGGVKGPSGALYTTDYRGVFNFLGDNAYRVSMKLQSIPAGASTISFAVRQACQLSGTPGASDATALIMTATGTQYTGASGSFTPSSIGADVASNLRTALTNAVTSFTTGESRAPTTGDVLMIKVNSAAATDRWHVEVAGTLA